ncbi:MAG: two-component system NarL family sensor kinase [Crocinitomicaceae bacterium]
MKMIAVVENFRNCIAVLLFLSISTSAFGQKFDSTGIVDFFSPKNLSQINDSSKDSVYKLIGDDVILQDLYHYSDARLKLQTGKFDEAMRIAHDRNSNLPGHLSEYYKAKYYNIIGSVYANKQDVKKAIIFFEKALRLSEDANEDAYAGMMENNIANMYFTLVDYKSAYEHSFKGYQLMKPYPENLFYNKLIAVLSISEAKIGKFAEAKKHGRIALKNAEESGDVIAIIVANLALGEVAINEKKYKEAKVSLIASLELSEKYQQVPFILLNSISLMVANLETKNFKLAVKYGEKAHALIDQVGDKTSTYSIKKNLAVAYFETNQSQKAYPLIREAHDIFRKTNDIENKKEINDLLLKYDSEKKEKELVSKKNELLKKNIEQNNLMIILGLLVVLIVSLAFIIGFIRHRNKSRIALMNSKQEMKVIEAVFEGEEIERERIARELHDGVASNLTAVRYQLLANNRISEEDKKQLEGILLKAHEDTRRLSHNLAPFSLETFGFEKALQQFAQENSIENCEVISTVIPTGVSIPKEKATILFRVAQELTQNAIKHAEATEISIQVLIDENMTLIVEDDGKGFDFMAKKDSNGMSSISKRGVQLNGTFEVDSSMGNGTIATFIIS